jgi:hypothetical protein
MATKFFLKFVRTAALLGGLSFALNAAIESVPFIRQRPEWNRFTILVWQYQTDVIQDQDLYKQAGLRGFHIDRGQNKNNLVQFSLKNHLPYYVEPAFSNDREEFSSYATAKFSRS